MVNWYDFRLEREWVKIYSLLICALFCKMKNIYLTLSFFFSLFLLTKKRVQPRSCSRAQKTPLFRAKIALHYIVIHAFALTLPACPDALRTGEDNQGVDDERRTGVQR